MGAGAEQPHAREPPILWFATQGQEHLDAARMRELLAALPARSVPFERTHRLRSALALARAARQPHVELLVMEGTGIAGGATLLALNALFGTRFVVSSGDAVGPYVALKSPLAGALAARYERLLCRRCAGYIGWTPYLAGRALGFGAPRAMTAPGFSRGAPATGARARVRNALGIAQDALVVGLVGTLNWRARIGYGYGAELVRAVLRTRRSDLVACIVGDGPGRERLREMAGEELGRRILLPGRVGAEEVADHLAAFDLASLPQSVDRVGSFRYSTKLPEYLGAGVPVVTGQIPAAYDLDDGFFWRLPGEAPWRDPYVDALAALLERLGADELHEHRDAIARADLSLFDRARQQRRTGAFIADILAAGASTAAPQPSSS